MRRFSLLLVIMVSLTKVRCNPQPQIDQPFQSLKVGELGDDQKKDAKKYLSQYGYTATYTDKNMKLNEVIKDFQYFAGLLVTGELDSTTLKWMKKNRCGLRDPPSDKKRKGRAGRVRRYNRQGTMWRKNTLTWKYFHNKMANNAWDRYPQQGMKEDEIKDLLRKAMGLWEKRTNIKFIEKNEAYTGRENEPDILIKFGTRRHANDPFPFDGPGGTLAHAFYPLENTGFAGDVHFDDDERFTIDNKIEDGRDFLWVATHELGHSLGLDHSSERDAVMYPFYMGYRRDFDLRYDDIIGIQSIYGGKIRTKKPDTAKPDKPKPTVAVTTTTTTTTTLKPVPAHKVCPTSQITAVWDYIRDGSYFMITRQGKLYTVSSKGKGMIDRNIDQNEYYKIPYTIDAVYQTDLGENTNTIYDVIFTSVGYYVYKGFNRVSGPFDYKSGSFNRDTFCREERAADKTPLKLDFPTSGRNAVTKIDAVIKWQRNNKVYFFTGDKYWRYDETKKMFDCGYPRLISPAWRGLGGKIDAAYSNSHSKRTFFIQGDNFYEFDDRLVHIKRGYPKSLKETMLKCEEPSVHVLHQRKRRNIGENNLNRFMEKFAAPEP